MPILKASSAHVFPDHIHTFLFYKASSENIENHLLLPDGYYTMIFNLGNSLYEITDKRVTNISGSVLIGLMTRPKQLKILPRTELIIVRFKPYSLYYYTGIFCSELTDQVIDLKYVFRHQYIPVLGRLQKPISFSQSTQIIEKGLFEISGNYPISNLVTEAVNLMLYKNGNLLINDLCEELKTTKTTLEKYFVKFIGVSPKLLAKVWRLQHCISQKLSKPQLSLTNIAYESSYYDQSHFIKEFKLITGMTPQKYFRSSFIKDLFLNCIGQSEHQAISNLVYFSNAPDSEKIAI